jgi:hypothetical protein
MPASKARRRRPASTSTQPADASSAHLSVQLLRSGTSSTAVSRLKVVLVNDRTGVDEQTMQKIRIEIQVPQIKTGVGLSPY